VRFVRVRLQAAGGLLPELAGFYGERLELPLLGAAADRVSCSIGETELEFVAAPGDPFYHFALLVPGDRFSAAFEWGRSRAELLPHLESGELDFEFESWAAHACYFHDPAGNIVELIALAGVAETGALGPFGAQELVGLSELALVGDIPAMAAALDAHLGLEVWDGSADGPGGLAFVGERARTLILAPARRGWLPTRRPAEPHRVEALLAAATAGEVALEDSRYRIRATAG